MRLLTPNLHLPPPLRLLERAEWVEPPLQREKRPFLFLHRCPRTFVIVPTSETDACFKRALCRTLPAPYALETPATVSRT